jgi:hypothetical protein
MQSSNHFGPRSGPLRHGLHRSLFIVALVYLMGLSAAVAQPVFFRFTSIADTSEHLFSHLNFPCFNNLSRIAFTGTLSSGVEGVFSRVNLGSFDTLADTGDGKLAGFGLDCSINHNAMIEFTALKKVSDGFDTLVMRGTGSSSSRLIDDTGTFSQLSGFQLNLAGKTALGARRASDGANVILTKGAGQLTGPQRIIAPGTGAISQFSSFATNPTINSSGTIAVAAFKNQNHTIHILTVDESGQVTVFLDDQGPFIGVGDVVINGSRSMAFHGRLAGGETGVWKIYEANGLSFIAQLASSHNTPCVDFNAVAISDLGAVAFACRDSTSLSSYVFLSDQFGLHRILGTGSQLFGRRVSGANIGREAINSDKRIAILVDFDGGSSAIVRAEPTSIPPDLINTVAGSFQLEVSSDGGGPTITTPVGPRATLVLLSFDLTFPNKTPGELQVMLGDKLLKSIAATVPGIRQHISIPVDLRKEPIKSVTQLRFAMTGKPGATVQISNVLIPGVISDAMMADTAERWHIDTSKGGYASTVDTTAFPVKVEVAPGSKQKNITAKRPVPVAILSSDGFDATHDIDRSTLSFNGALLEPDTKNSKQPRCTDRDVNGDKLPDLVCDVTFAASPKSTVVQSVTVEAMSIFGWNIVGSSAEPSACNCKEESTP